MATISAIHNGFYVVKTHYQNPLNLLMKRLTLATYKSNITMHQQYFAAKSLCSTVRGHCFHKLQAPVL
jgi:hypothetical protein